MVRMSWWMAGAVAFTAGVAGSACKREAETGSVTTRTEGGATTAPSAAPAARSDRALVRVVNALEQGSSTLEESLALWERGEALARRCEEWLIGAKARLDAARADAAGLDAARSAAE